MAKYSVIIGGILSAFLLSCNRSQPQPEFISDNKRYK